MKLSASKFNEKNVFRQFQKYIYIYFSQMSAVRTGVLAYMDATPLAHTYGLLTKREVKMAGYWPNSFFLRAYGPRQS